MTNEEMAGVMQFILSQQVLFAANQRQVAADIRNLTGARARTERTLGSTEDRLARIAATQLQIAETQAQSDSRLSALAQSQKRIDEAMAEGRERLKALMVVIERYLSNGRGRQ